MRLPGRIEPGNGAGQLTGQPHFFANSGFSPALYLILGAVRADEVLAAGRAALRMALLVAEKAVGSAWLAVVAGGVGAGAVDFCSVQAVRMLIMTNSQKACRHD